MESLDESVNPHEDAAESKVNRVVDQDPDPEEAVQSKELLAALTECLDGLPPEQREVFWLKERSGLSLSEIADMTNVSLNTVKSRLRYALEKIRTDMAKRGFRP